MILLFMIERKHIIKQKKIILHENESRKRNLPTRDKTHKKKKKKDLGSVYISVDGVIEIDGVLP